MIPLSLAAEINGESEAALCLPAIPVCEKLVGHAIHAERTEDEVGAASQAEQRRSEQV
jgi:hypothetical protein